jgi:hypothetical protein
MTNRNINSSTSTSNNTNSNTNYNYGDQTVRNINTNTSTSTNTNNNINTGDMTNRNINTSTSTSTNANTNTNVNTGDMTNRNIQTGDMTNRNISNSTSANTSNNTNTNINSGSMVNQNINSGEMTNTNINKTEITQRVIQPPPTAVAPAMMSGGNADLCTTGTSGSIQTQIFGVGAGSTARDLNCERLKLSKTLYDMGMKVAAVATMCQDRRVFDAMLAAGTPCPYEGKIGEQAKAAWEANPEKLPKAQKEQIDDTYKKVGFGALLGILVHNAFK